MTINTMTTFGSLIESIRLQSEITLRQLSRDIGFDPAYISRIETNKVKPSDKFTQKFVEYFGIENGTATHDKIMDSASIARAEIPDYVLDNKEVVAKLPLFFRTISGKNVDASTVDDLLEYLKNNAASTNT